MLSEVGSANQKGIFHKSMKGTRRWPDPPQIPPVHRAPAISQGTAASMQASNLLHKLVHRFGGEVAAHLGCRCCRILWLQVQELRAGQQVRASESHHA